MVNQIYFNLKKEKKTLRIAENTIFNWCLLKCTLDIKIALTSHAISFIILNIITWGLIIKK